MTPLHCLSPSLLFYLLKLFYSPITLHCDYQQGAHLKHQPKAPRTVVRVDTFSANGLECRCRALLETERRLFGNKNETTFNETNDEPDLTLSEREKGVLVLDKRTSFRGSVLGQAEWKSAVKSLEKF